jgi:hypothetical protein
MIIIDDKIMRRFQVPVTDCLPHIHWCVFNEYAVDEVSQLTPHLCMLRNVSVVNWCHSHKTFYLYANVVFSVKHTFIYIECVCVKAMTAFGSVFKLCVLL